MIISNNSLNLAEKTAEAKVDIDQGGTQPATYLNAGLDHLGSLSNVGLGDSIGVSDP